MSKGANINCKDNEDETPLHYGIFCRNFQSLQDKTFIIFIIAFKLDPISKNIVQILCSANADVNSKNKNGLTPFNMGI